MGRSASARDRYLDAALELLDEGEPLTLHRLGERLGLTHTAVYRHFSDLRQLVNELFDRELGDELTAPLPADATPREQIVTLALRVRRGLMEHHALAGALLSADYPVGSMANVAQRGLSLLREIGLEGADLAMVYRSFESVLLGTTVFDVAASPDHLAIRRERMRQFGDGSLNRMLRTDTAVGKVNEAGFRFTIDALLDASEALVAARAGAAGSAAGGAGKR
jgi:AcrR family transcriptional regulator